jgi:D-alanyl-D-alanine carboxypeptidase/D-alanyl-D-alanine-endopeptidase (penicillin-binding protein 4)
MRAPVVVAALLAALVTPAASSASLENALERALHVPHVSLAATGADVLDLETGDTVYSHNASLSLLPASNEKLAVTYAALTALGPAFRIETDVLGTGEQTGSTWRGNLVLKGYGDPTLSSADLVGLAAGAPQGSAGDGPDIGDESGSTRAGR